MGLSAEELVSSEPEAEGSDWPRALLLYGGWEGHDPLRVAEFASERLLNGYSVTRCQSLEVFRPEVLCEFDVLLPIWTFGELNDNQVTALLEAVAGGLGMVTWHGAASSFLNSRSHKLLLGGQFVGHPGGEKIEYAVRFQGDDPLVEGLEEFTLVSEQYYLLVDPGVKVLATTSIDGGEYPWLAGVEMPVAWSRAWGAGRVFYCSLGHTAEVLEGGAVPELLRRAVLWATRPASARARALPELGKLRSDAAGQ